MAENIAISWEAGVERDIESVIVAPEKALEEHGYIEALTTKDSANAKHEYHAMGQMAYYQYQDDELDLKEILGPIVLEHDGEKKEIETGLVLMRDGAGGFSVLIHKNLPKKKMLEAVHRYCTRWIRLDI